MDTIVLARIQFAMTIAFHYIFPPLSIGLGLLLVFMEGAYLKTRDPLYQEMTKFWVKVFGLTFSMGVVSGVVMEFQFGTNWAYYSRYVGDVFGSALAAEGIFAFFLESGFLAVLLFGWDRVGPKMHFFSTCMVAFGSLFSAVWIVIANSWMQTPAGYHLVTDAAGRERAEILDFWALIFNPSSMDRLGHVVAGCWQAGAWLVISVSAFYLLKGLHTEFAKRSLKIALVTAFCVALFQLVTGHASGKVVSHYQPAKLAAMEGHYDLHTPAAMYLWGWVDEKAEKTHGAAIPGALSWLITGDASAPLQGLKSFDLKDRPPVNIVFQTYHVMIAIGVGLIVLSGLGIFFLLRGTLFQQRWLLCLFVPAVLGPQIANQAGWMTAEIGRQPWIVYGLLRTSEGVSRVVSSHQVLASILMFSFVYLLLFILFVYLLDQKIKHGPASAKIDSSHQRA